VITRGGIRACSRFRLLSVPAGRIGGNQAGNLDTLRNVEVRLIRQHGRSDIDANIRETEYYKHLIHALPSLEPASEQPLRFCPRLWRSSAIDKSVGIRYKRLVCCGYVGERRGRRVPVQSRTLSRVANSARMSGRKFNHQGSP
jgi:hypothetical protein